ncbi:hypothetical protein BGX30_011073 [Mortierella sp. GBA39]|nr:hypothetical protein BGX30_011073 [Mortierella sp. GBA39]
MTDHAIYQQSKQLAGLSITNSSGTKVSILNDNPSELGGASSNPDGSAQQADMRSPHASELHGQHSSSVRSPRSPHFRDRAGVRDYFSEERRDPYYYPSSSSSSHKSHRHRSESYETGRSTSLTNAATPFRSGFDTRGQDALANSQRSRSLSSGAQLYPYSNGPYPSSPAFVPPPGSSPLPFFMRAFSEDVSQDDHDGYRGYMGHPGLPEGLIAGPSFSKRKYSCTHPGCNKRFTTSGHLARHNRIHTGERNFACLMPGCPSKFSRQDNMMQHYRTHISPKSRRGGSKKYDPQDPEAGGVEGSEFESAEYLASPSQDNNNSPSVAAAALPPTGSSRHGSRHNSPPRSFSSEVQQQHGGEGMDCDDQDRPASRQRSQDSPKTRGLQSAAAYPPPLPTSTTSHHRERERGEHHHHHHHHQGGAQDGGPQPWSVPDSPTSPMTQAVERMEDVASTRDQQLFYYRQQQQYQQQYQQEYQQRQQLKKQRQQEAKATAAAAAAAASGHYHATAHHLSHSGAGSSSSTNGDHRERDHSHRHHHHHHGGHGSSSLHGSGSRSLGSPTLTSSSTSSAAELHPRAYSYSHSQHTHSSLDRPMMSGSNSGGRTGSLTSAAMAAMSMAAASSTPLSPQSTPATPTKYRFDPIQDCIQQERRQREEATL